jgi:hypothetical protein
MAIINSTTVPEDGTTFIFSPWVCVANGQGSFDSHIANPMKPEAPSPASSHGVDTLADIPGKIQLSNLVRNYTSHLRAIPYLLINAGNLITGVDRVGCNIARCIKLAGATLQHPGNPGS